MPKYKNFPVGKHLLVDLKGCNPEKLKNIQDVENLMIEATKISGATIVGKFFQQFKPYGVSGVIIIEESHFSIHTWPEHGLASLDYYSCANNVDMDKAIAYIKQELGADYEQRAFFTRGGLKLIDYNISEKVHIDSSLVNINQQKK